MVDRGRGVPACWSDTATLRYYERLGLFSTTRTAGNQRRYPRYVLRRLAFVAAAQRVGLTLTQIGDLLGQLPDDHAPTQQDWTCLAGPWRQLVQARVRELQALQHSRRVSGLRLPVPDPVRTF